MIDSAFQTRIQHVVDEQGWDDNTVLGLALDYIANQQADDAFIDHLRGVQNEENSASVWPDNDEERIRFVDWQYEVGNGDTVLGFRDWLTAKEDEDEEED